MAKRIALFIDRADWHARRLTAAFAARGVEAVPLPMGACGFRSDLGHGLALPGFEAELPDAAFVRCVPGGSFEQVTARLGVLHALGALGVPVSNDARAIERCVDKSMTSFLLSAAGLPTPATWVCEDREQACAIVRQEARPMVLKPLFGSQGRGLRLVERETDLPAAEDVSGVYYLQRHVGSAGAGWRDWRVLVAGGQAIAAMERHGDSWITNAHQGARCVAVAADGALAELALAAAGAVGADYAGVDLIRDAEAGTLVLEVNSMPAWSALQAVSNRDIAQAIVDGVLEATPRPRRASGDRP